MTNKLTPEYINKGVLITCDEGKAILQALDKIDDDDLVETCSDEFKAAWDKWIDHRKTCEKCGYI